MCDIAGTPPGPAGLRFRPADASAAASESCVSASEKFSAVPGMLCNSGLLGEAQRAAFQSWNQKET